MLRFLFFSANSYQKRLSLMWKNFYISFAYLFFILSTLVILMLFRKVCSIFFKKYLSTADILADCENTFLNIPWIDN